MISIREIVTDKDLDAIKHIYAKAFNICKEVLDEDCFGFPNYVKFCESQGYSYMAFINDEPCGVILAFKIPEMMYGEEIYIELLAVLPEHQKKGVCTKLLNTVKKKAVDNGIKRLGIRTACYMDSYDVYKKYGFKDSKSDLRYMRMIIKNEKSIP